MSLQKTAFKVADFVTWQKAKSLELSPRFQRRSVWKPGAKSYLIDTILREFPVPIIEALGLTKAALDVVRGVKDLLPDSPEKVAAADSLNNAARAVREAEAQAAVALGYEICQCDWPPSIALRHPDGIRRCPKCHRNVDQVPGVGGGGY